MWFWPWTQAPARGRHHRRLPVGDANSSEHHRRFAVEESWIHVEEGESSAASVHDYQYHYEVAGGSEQEGSSGSDGGAAEAEAAGRRAVVRRRRNRGRRRRTRAGGGGLPAFVSSRLRNVHTYV
jgi:hypothetical protein